MKLQSRVQYTLTNQSGDTFDAALDAGYEPVAEGGKIYFSLSDASGNYAECEGRISGGKFIRQELYLTDNADGVSLPNFDATVTARSAFPAFMTERSFGEAALVALGDETLVGFTNGGYDSEKDLVDPDILQARYNWRNSAGTLTTVDDVVVAGYPLYHSRQYAVADSVSPLNAIAAQLKKRCGFKSIRVLPATEGGVALSSFEQGGDNYTRVVDLLTSFLGNSANQIACFVVSLGRAEAKAGISEALMASRLDALQANLISDIGIATGRDISAVPFLFVGYSEALLTNFPAAAAAQAAISDSPNRRASAGYINGAGLTTVGSEDYDAQASRDLALRFVTSYFNIYRPATSAAVTGAVAEESGGIVGNGSAVSVSVLPASTLDAGSMVAAVENVVGAVTGAVAEESGSAVVQGTPNALTADMTLIHRADTGVTADGSSNISAIQDLSSLGIDSTQSDPAYRPIDDSGQGIEFRGNSGALELNPAAFNDTRGFAYAIDFTSDNANPATNLLGGSSNTPTDGLANLINIFFSTQRFYLHGTLVTLPIENKVLDGTRKILTVSFDLATGVCRIWFNNTEVFTQTLTDHVYTPWAYVVLGNSRDASGGYFAAAPVSVHAMAVAGRPIDGSELSDLHAFLGNV